MIRKEVLRVEEACHPARDGALGGNHLALGDIDQEGKEEDAVKKGEAQGRGKDVEIMMVCYHSLLFDLLIKL